MINPLDVPFPWFGGKRRVAKEVWAHFGDIRNYVEPFFGSGAVLFGRPRPFYGPETINDLDGYVANFWRAIKGAPEEVAEWADNPVNENDLHARHVWLIQQSEILREQLDGDPDWYNPKIAGWWAWGVSCWIGGRFCSGRGPWWPDNAGRLVHLGNNGRGVSRKRVHLGNNGEGVNRQLVQLSDNGRGVNRQRVHLGNNGEGVNRQLVHLGNNGQGEDLSHSRLYPWFQALAERLERVRVCSGDWTRVCGSAVTFSHGLTGVFLDPPYADTARRQSNLYRIDSMSVAHDVRDWCLANGDNPLLRIALCGYEGEHEMPASWRKYNWKSSGGDKKNNG